MKGSKLAAAFVLSLALLTVASAGTGILAQTTDALKSEYMVQVMESARAGAENALAQLQFRNMTLPVDLNATYAEAVNRYHLALQYRSQANYSGCNEQALLAQNMFREVAAYATALGVNGDQPGEEALRARIELRARITRMQSVIDELSNATAKMDNAGVNASGVAGNLAQLRLRLENATLAMNGGDAALANQTAAEVEESLAELVLQFKNCVSETDALRARIFIRNAEQMMLDYEARVNAQANVSEAHRQEALALMNQAMLQLRIANSTLESGNLTGALRLMEQVRIRLQEACVAMGEGNQTRAQLELRIMSMQMEAECVANRIQALKGYGFNVSAQEQEMVQIREQLRTADCANASAECSLAQIQARIRDIGQALEEMEGQRQAQERARIQGEIDALWQRLENCTQRARQFKQGGSNVSQIELMIQQATSITNEAQLRLNGGDLVSAERMVSQAGGIVSQAEGALNQMGGGHGGSGGRP
ncbi:MAG: hypothetical protein ACQXXL_01765 [Candidatus Methanosuratincola sp.]